MATEAISNPDTSLNHIDRIVHEPGRLKILSQLYVIESADFLFIMQQTGLTQGNLSSHISKLEAAGYVEVQKAFVKKRPKTLLRMTRMGREAFEAYVTEMKRLLDDVPVPGPAPVGKSKGARRRSRASLGICLVVLLAGVANARTTEIHFKSYDGYPMLGKLTMPETRGPHPVVIYVQTAEAMTADMKRPGRGGTFNYFDLYRTKLAELNVGFFTYEGRGISGGDSPPRYEAIDWPVYNTSTLENKVRDVLSAVQVVRKERGVKLSRIFLMGASEGTLLAAEAASRAPLQIRGLVLYGVMATSMRDAFKFMVSDGGFIAYRGFFDTDKDGAISKQEFEADPQRYRERALRNADFATFDRNRDGLFTVDEMRLLSKAYLDAVDSDDYQILNRWARTAAGVSTPDNWFKDHFEHAPIWTFLSRLDMPIGLFHGEADTQLPVGPLRQLEASAKKARKSRMTFHYFEGLDHSLGIGQYFMRGTLPAGHKAIFEYIARQAR